MWGYDPQKNFKSSEIIIFCAILLYFLLTRMKNQLQFQKEINNVLFYLSTDCSIKVSRSYAFKHQPSQDPFTKDFLLKSLELSSVHPCTVFILLEHLIFCNVTVLESIAMMSESMYQILCHTHRWFTLLLQTFFVMCSNETSFLSSIKLSTTFMVSCKCKEIIYTG